MERDRRGLVRGPEDDLGREEVLSVLQRHADSVRTAEHPGVELDPQRRDRDEGRSVPPR
jgi:hypothetical protein